MIIFIALIISISMTAVAGYFAIAGLMTIYGVSIGIIAMGIVMELGKIATVSIMYQFWKVMSFIQKTIGFLILTILLTLTSLGVYGYLTKGYIEQVAPANNNTLVIENIQNQIDMYQTNLLTSKTKVELLNTTMQGYIKEGFITRGRKELGADFEKESQNVIFYQTEINKLEKEKLKLQQENQDIHNELGVLQYFVDTFVGEGKTSKDMLVIFTVILVSALDPAAIMLLWFVNTAYHNRHSELVRSDIKEILFSKKQKLVHESDDNTDTVIEQETPTVVIDKVEPVKKEIVNETIKEEPIAEVTIKEQKATIPDTQRWLRPKQ